MTEKEKQQLIEVAKKHMYEVQRRGNLESRGADSEDFIEVSVWSLEAALLEAYQLGRAMEREQGGQSNE